MDELGAGGGGGAGEIVLLDQQDAEAAAGGVAGDPGPVDAAADDQEIDDVAARPDRQVSASSPRPASPITARSAVLPRLRAPILPGRLKAKLDFHNRNFQ